MNEGTNRHDGDHLTNTDAVSGTIGTRMRASMVNKAIRSSRWVFGSFAARVTVEGSAGEGFGPAGEGFGSGRQMLDDGSWPGPVKPRAVRAVANGGAGIARRMRMSCTLIEVFVARSAAPSSAWAWHLPCRGRVMNEYVNRHATLSEAIEDLKQRGYTDELELSEDRFCHHNAPLHPEDFKIDEFHRFEGPSDPADMSIVYAVSSEKLGLKGLLVNAFGTYASSVVQRMVHHLDAHQAEGRVKPVQPAKPGENVRA
jgi:hypothetical protein